MKSNSLSMTFLSRKRLRSASTENERVAFNLVLLIGRERIDIQTLRYSFLVSLRHDSLYFTSPSNSIFNCGMNISRLCSPTNNTNCAALKKRVRTSFKRIWMAFLLTDSLWPSGCRSIMLASAGGPRGAAGSGAVLDTFATDGDEP